MFLNKIQSLVKDSNCICFLEVVFLSLIESSFDGDLIDFINKYFTADFCIIQ